MTLRRCHLELWERVEKLLCVLVHDTTDLSIDSFFCDINRLFVVV